MNKTAVYPSTEEILPNILLNRIPATLAHDVEERYELLGPKYLTDKTAPDGRLINACMFKSSVQDAIEEVIDAVFNTCVWIFKDSQNGKIDPNAYSCLMGLIEIYSLMQMAKEQNAGV